VLAMKTSCSFNLGARLMSGHLHNLATSPQLYIECEGGCGPKPVLMSFEQMCVFKDMISLDVIFVRCLAHFHRF